ncbi:hypothetical protein NIBR502774_19725 (plasmid) [Rhizobium sp. NIBRBAC000502774]|nr:hypothetical protein NIBR502774_19725 [Rhizobium sp. NIBRBAC000502774]
MKMKIVGIVATLMLSACASTSSISYTGNSVADGTLKGDITKYVSLFFLNGVGAGCNGVDAISMRVQTKQMSANGQLANAHEIWTVHGCAKSGSYNVKMNADGAGGTHFRVSAL